MDAAGHARNMMFSEEGRSTNEKPSDIRSQCSPRLAGSFRRAEAPVRLTPRELEVLRLLAEGLPNKLICRRLGISAGTVKIHVSRVLAELGVSSRLEAVIIAQRLGVLRVDVSAAERPQHPPPGLSGESRPYDREPPRFG